MTDTAADRIRRYVDDRMEIQGIPTLAELQRRSGVSYDTVLKFRAGRTPDRQTVVKLAGALGVTYGDLVAVREGIAPEEPPETLYAALERQTAAITALVAELRASLRGVERGLEVAAKLREDATSRGPNEPRSRAGARR